MANKPIASDEDIDRAFQQARSAWSHIRARGLVVGLQGLDRDLERLRDAWWRAGELPTVSRPRTTREDLYTAVAGALKAVDDHAPEFAGQEAWNDLRQVRTATRAVRSTAMSLTGDRFWATLRNDLDWRAFWHHVEANSSAAYARCAASLADRLEAGPSSPRTESAVAALRDLRNAASEYSARLRETAPQQALAPEAGAERINADLARMHHPYAGYGPREGAAESREDLRRINREVTQSSTAIANRFNEWLLTDSGKRAFRSHASTKALSDARKQLPPLGRLGSGDDMGRDADQYRLAARLYGRFANMAAAEAARRSVTDPPRDVALLEAVAKDAQEHARRLARTLPPGNDPSARAYPLQSEALESGEDVVAAFRSWRTTDMAQKLLRHGADDRIRAFGEAWRALYPARSHSAPFDPQADAVAFAAAARAARHIAWSAEKSRRYSYQASDIAGLRRVADAADKHASRLAATPKPRSATPARNRLATLGPSAAVGSPAPVRPGVAGPRAGDVGLG
ncbi:hypothetical protein [Streptomyces sp. WMMC940]|uniref:hypothetical protein n=1 Tax=Streptomyces sp. WMMC940 TaxID=3015153 RepID=UPI0022B6E6EC|nr:hypothetical protein [Streptomyces sp. WMMC940]MCZ7458226.1 hypothetical protein [Streptomyces sp. WMMC940]